MSLRVCTGVSGLADGLDVGNLDGLMLIVGFGVSGLILGTLLGAEVGPFVGVYVGFGMLSFGSGGITK